jgi:16S rRNA processing protein RimM
VTLALTVGQHDTRRFETTIEDFRFQHGRWVAKLKGINSIAEAEGWIGAQVSIRQSEWPTAEPGSFFSFDVEGCTVYAAGEAIGTVKRILDYAGATLLQLEADGEEILVPFVRSFLKEIDTAGKRIEMELPEGLIELNKRR